MAVASRKWLSTVQLQSGENNVELQPQCLFTYWTRVHDIWKKSAYVTTKSNVPKLGNAGCGFSHPLGCIPCVSVFSQ